MHKLCTYTVEMKLVFWGGRLFTPLFRQERGERDKETCSEVQIKPGPLLRTQYTGHTLN